VVALVGLAAGFAAVGLSDRGETSRGQIAASQNSAGQNSAGQVSPVQNADPLVDRRAEAERRERAEDALARLLGPRLMTSVDATHREMLLKIAEDGAPRAVGMVACFAPGTPDETMRAFTILNNQFNPRFTSGPRWGPTALDPGSTGTDGTPTTITWSIVNDGLNIPGFNGEPASPSDLRARLDALYGSSATWLPIFQGVFDRWQALTGLNYVYQPTDDGAVFDDSLPGSEGAAGLRGDVRISGHIIDGPSGVLAYNFYPDGGDMVIDSGDFDTGGFYLTTTSSSLRLRNVLSHEHGHGMGEPHVCPVHATKLMEPFAQTTFDGPQHDDIRGAHQRYGDIHEPDDSTAQATVLSITSPSTTVLGTPPAPAMSFGSTLSLDANGEQDYFRFTAQPGVAYTLTLTPVGHPYEDNPQSGSCCASGSCCYGAFINSASRMNLDLQLIAANGSTVLQTANLNPVGVAETVTNFAVTGGVAENVFVRVFETGSADDVQLYTLTINAAASGPLAMGPAGLVPTRVTPGATSNFDVWIRRGTGTVVGTPQLEYRIGSGGTITSPLTNLGGGLYRATLPSVPCGQDLKWLVSANATTGTSTLPSSGFFTALAVGAETTVFSDTFETNLGWTTSMQSIGGTVTGLWERSEPVGNGNQPQDDITPGAGTLCYVTQNAIDCDGTGIADIDNGSVILTSPVFSLAGMESATVSYWRSVYFNTAGDTFVAEISSNGGSSWTPLETVLPTTDTRGGWIFKSFDLSGTTLTATMRLRFTASDFNPQSQGEAAVDDVLITGHNCPATCPADVDDGSGTGTPDGGVTIDDLIYYLSLFENGDIGADVDDGSGTGTPDGGVTIDDLIYYLTRFEAGC
jgi:hypothetical protein